MVFKIEPDMMVILNSYTEDKRLFLLMHNTEAEDFPYLVEIYYNGSPEFTEHYAHEGAALGVYVGILRTRLHHQFEYALKLWRFRDA